MDTSTLPPERDRHLRQRKRDIAEAQNRQAGRVRWDAAEYAADCHDKWRAIMLMNQVIFMS